MGEDVGEGHTSERIMDYYSLLFTFSSRVTLLSSTLLISGIGGFVIFILDDRINPLTGGPLGLLSAALPLMVADLFTIPLFRGGSLS